MKEAPRVNLEMTIVLPLGVVAHQLMKIEADLRQLNMKALDFARERDNAPHTGLIEARLEKINDALDSIRALVSDIAADLRPHVVAPVRSNRDRRDDRDD
jgi:hypothetical protein